MEKRLTFIDRVSNLALLGMLFFFVASFFVDIFNLYSSVCICIVYVCTYFRVRIQTQKSNWMLFVFCMLSIVWMFINLLFPFTYGPVISNFFVYLYLNLTTKISSGKWNKYLVFVGVFGVLGQLLNILFNVTWVIFITLILQLFALFKYMDPLLERIALEKKAKRLGVDYETVKAQYHNKA